MAPPLNSEEFISVSAGFLTDEFAKPGDLVFLQVVVENNIRRPLDEVRITTTIQELGIRQTAGPFTLHSGESAARTLVLDLPYSTPKGEYWVMFTVSNDDVQRVIYRVLTVR